MNYTLHNHKDKRIKKNVPQDTGIPACKYERVKVLNVLGVETKYLLVEITLRLWTTNSVTFIKVIKQVIYSNATQF